MSQEFVPSLEAVHRLTSPSNGRDPFAEAVRGARLPMLVTAGEEQDHAILYVNDAFTELTGYRLEEVAGRNPRFLQGEGSDPACIKEMRRALAEGREASVEVVNYRKNGGAFWNGMFMSPVRDGDAIVYWFGSMLDVSKRKEAELALRRSNLDLEARVADRTSHLRVAAEQKTVLLHEVEHRVKNNLQLIASLLQFQSRRTTDPAVKDALRLVQERVSAVSTAHRRLFHTSDVACFDVGLLLRDVVEDLVGRARREDLRVGFDLQPVQAPSADAAPLGLLVSEILSHAVRPDVGELRVRLSKALSGCTIELSDDGPLDSQGLRHQLEAPGAIAEIVKRQLHAEIELRDNHPGVTALIRLPGMSA